MLTHVKTWVFILQSWILWRLGMGMVNPGQNWHFQRIGALVGCFPDLSCRFPRNLRRFESSPGGWRHWWKKQSTWRRPWCSSVACSTTGQYLQISPGAELQKRPLTCLEVEVLWCVRISGVFLIVLSVVDIVLGCFGTPFWGCISNYVYGLYRYHILSCPISKGMWLDLNLLHFYAFFGWGRQMINDGME